MRITLTDGRQVYVSEIHFDARSHYFFLRNEDVTNLIRRADKLTNWSSFDPVKDNIRLSTGNAQSPQLSTNTLGIFAGQLLTDPLDAPLDSLSNQVKKIFSNGGILTILLIVAVVGFFYFGGGNVIRRKLA
jgi:hypothetical protein